MNYYYKKKLHAIQPLAVQALLRLNRTLVIEPRELPDKLCHKCGCYWPPTEEFFYPRTGGGFASPCRACQQEQKQQAFAVKPCAYPGCNQPRYRTRNGKGKYTSYCADHQYHGRKRS